ncbi:TPA: hypothetical protein JD771_002484 [Legionella pneumophila subsp. pneumophila]|nr:hypothetical protein [Legionella pneumophila subsp. pneumophila]
MDIKTALYWDVKSNSISYLICQIGKKDFGILYGPETFIIESRKPDEFSSEARSILETYFEKLKDNYNKKNAHKIIIEHRIVHSGAPAHVFIKTHPWNISKNLTADRSGIVYDLFKEYRAELEENYNVLNNDQVKSILKNDDFKIILKNLGVIDQVKTGKYKWHLWSIFLHLSSRFSSTDHEKIRKNLWRPIVDAANSQIGNETRYEEWLENALK